MYHQQRRKRIHKKYEEFPHPKRVKRVYDNVIYVAVILAPIMNLPQLWKIWSEKEAAGVSVVSWVAFSFISVMWLIYGILHKERPVILMNIALIFLQLTIAFGAYLYG
jgi:uncharacterized protein with PQ loop repeat